MSFNIKTDSPRATSIDAADVLVFGDVSADGLDTITVGNFLGTAVSLAPADSARNVIQPTAVFGTAITLKAPAGQLATSPGDLFVGVDENDANLWYISTLGLAAFNALQIDGSVSFVKGPFTSPWMDGQRVSGVPMVGFLGAAAVARQDVTGDKAGNSALASVVAALVAFGLITDSTT
jgi:hypothetical protein